MSVDLHFNGDTWADVALQMRAALGAGVVFEQADAVEALKAPNEYEKAATRTRGPNKPKSEPVVETKAAETEDEVSLEMTVVPTDGNGKILPLNYETDIKPLVLEIAGRFGRDKVMEVLAKFGVTNAGHVPVEDQPALMEDIRLVLEG